MALSAREFVESFAALLVMFLDATFTSFPKEELIKLTPIKAITAQSQFEIHTNNPLSEFVCEHEPSF